MKYLKEKKKTSKDSRLSKKFMSFCKIDKFTHKLYENFGANPLPILNNCYLNPKFVFIIFINPEVSNGFFAMFKVTNFPKLVSFKTQITLFFVY